MAPNPRTVLEAALLYARRGWRVLPLNGKVPVLKDWPKTATTDPDVIQDWFNGEYCDANIGIATGEGSGIFVLDIDGEGGEASLFDLETTYGKLPETYEVETARGRHLYFIQPPGVHTKTQATGEIGLKLDIRGDGGQVVAPPSVHPETKKLYRVVRDCVPAHPPQWLIDRITRDQKKSAASGKMPDKIPQSQRNSTLTRIAGKMRREGLDSEEIYATLSVINKQRCSPALKDNEIVTIAKSVGRYDPGRVMVDGSYNDAELVVSTASEGKDLPVTWRWPLFLPRGMLVGWGGDPGQGKSTMAYMLAACVSNGKPMPLDDMETRYEPGDVLVLSAEDDPSKTIRPRLRLAGADMKRISIVSPLTKGVMPLSFPTHLVQLSELIRAKRAELVIIDPLDSFLGEEVDSHVNASVRRAIMPLVQIAENANATILVLGHLNKATGNSAIYRFSGSIAFIAASRCAFSFADSEERGEDYHVMACVKTNVARKPKSLLYTIEEQHVPEVGSVARIKFEGESDETAASSLAAGTNGTGGNNKMKAKVEEFLKDVLKDGPRLSNDVYKELRAADICSKRSFDTYRRMYSEAEKINERWWMAESGFDWEKFKIEASSPREPGEEE